MWKRLGVLLIAIAVATALAAPAQAGKPKKPKWKSEFLAAPNFPESQLYLKVKGKPAAGQRVRVRVWGTNKSGPISPGSGIAYDYSLDLFVAARSVINSCPQAFDEMRSIFIANDDMVGHLYSGLYLGEGGAFTRVLPYKSGGTRKVIYCAYVRWTIDDVVVAALRHNLRPPKKH